MEHRRIRLIMAAAAACSMLIVRSSDCLVLSQCISNLWALPRLSCTGNSILYVEQAYVAQRPVISAPDSVDRMCMSNSSYAGPIDVGKTRPTDCVLNVDDVTDDVIVACSTFASCRVPSAQATNTYAGSESGTNCSDGSMSAAGSASLVGGYRYISIVYECLPTTQTINGNSITFVYMTSSVSYVGLRDAFFSTTSGYPIDWNRARNRCLVLLPANVSASLEVLDARARAINASPSCAYRLLVVGEAGNSAAIVYGDWCAESNWTRRTILVQDTGPFGMRIGIMFDPASNSTVEGKLWIMMTVLNASVGLPADDYQVQCGPEVAGLPTTSWQPTTISSQQHGETTEDSGMTSSATYTSVATEFAVNISTPVSVLARSVTSAWSWQILVILLVTLLGVGLLLVTGIVIAAVARRRHSRRLSRRRLGSRNSGIILAWSDSLPISKDDDDAAAAAAEESTQPKSMPDLTEVAIQHRPSSTCHVTDDAEERNDDIVGCADVVLPVSRHSAAVAESSSSDATAPGGSRAAQTVDRTADSYAAGGVYANLSPDNRSISA